ncbi:MAG: hypothetical protein UT86_C0001G0238 [Candidatus Magasanikbacteria bacterium GW2011_GWC2_40_17]|uniref:Uncharacterized protein n=1 Tax=Candidatus Magasanikbacteria bacterium GW2011_GWA2_42_32 TaxID=1619039 RepID=A0A0G1D6E3_9BACT|nr:MAG: hypothetical protein UT86_C0001G0238 [Candidatus Magasanikbacteria bacterium GW2011_GWC2_40_17]KKS57598.1 MAG: hypothetical protein UV20_C0001G0238 [Candidatus Magasanikbacteria bacterium GW2011_GWA2_42_32]
MRVYEKLSNEEIEREFTFVLQEGYAAGLLSHSQAIYMTPAFRNRYGEVIEKIGNDEVVKRLKKSILDDLGKPNAVGQDFAHMELFIAEFCLALTNDEDLLDKGDEVLGELEAAAGFRTLSLNALLGFCAMYLYQKDFPPPPKQVQAAA